MIGNYPTPEGALVEGGAEPAAGLDRHMMVDEDGCTTSWWHG